MINELRNIILNNWNTLPHVGEDVPTADQLSITKFCQRIVQPHTKVLFLVTFQNKPVCLIKIMRAVRFNKKLEREKKSQQTIKPSGIVYIPQVYFDGYSNGLYFYAEEVIQGLPISRKVALKKEKELVHFSSSFPTYGEITASNLASIISEHLPTDSNQFLKFHLEQLHESPAILKKGFTHSDFARPNLIHCSGRIYVIDWERAGDRPFWLLDAVYLMVRLRKIKDFEDWKKRAAPLLSYYTSITLESAGVLYSLLIIFEILYKKYPEHYKKLVSQFS